MTVCPNCGHVVRTLREEASVTSSATLTRLQLVVGTSLLILVCAVLWVALAFTLHAAVVQIAEWSS